MEERYIEERTDPIEKPLVLVIVEAIHNVQCLPR